MDGRLADIRAWIVFGVDYTPRISSTMRKARRVWITHFIPSRMAQKSKIERDGDRYEVRG